MSEIQAGLAKPMTTAEFDAFLEQWTPQIHDAHFAAEALRNKIANGKRSVRDAREGKIHGLAGGAIERAEQRIAELEQELRQHDAWLTIGMGFVLAWGVADIFAKASKEEGWQPPANSVMRLVLPGLINVAVDLTQ